MANTFKIRLQNVLVVTSFVEYFIIEKTHREWLDRLSKPVLPSSEYVAGHHPLGWHWALLPD